MKSLMMISLCLLVAGCAEHSNSNDHENPQQPGGQTEQPGGQNGQTEQPGGESLKKVALHRDITGVQPGTGIVFWPDQAKSLNADLNDPESCCKAADQWFKARFIDKKGSNEKYYRNVITAYKKNKKQVPATLKQLDAAYEKLYQESHPVSYKLELKKQ